MMQSQRKALPVLMLLGVEIAAIVGLQAASSLHAMQIPWNDLSNWINTSSLNQLVPPLACLTALVFAYWMFVSTALCVIAQVSRIPAAVRATSMLTIPSVRRVIDGAMVVSIATTSVIGAGGAAAFADDASSQPAASDVTTSMAMQVDGSSTTSISPVDNDVTTGTDNSSTAATPDGTSDAGTDDGSQQAAGTTTTTVTDSTSVAPTPGDDSVPTPSPGAPLPSSTTTSTTVPQGPSTPAITTPTPAPSTDNGSSSQTNTNPSDHRVVAGENLWTISRDALAASSGQPASSISEAQIRDYWLKVIDANRDHLRSKDPHWIFPGEIITLPAQ
jgi:nucleoid-associated protein YgaU